MENVIAGLVLVILVGGAVVYLIKAKKSGVKCIGCPAGGKCSGGSMKRKKKLNGLVIGRKTLCISGMNCAHCVQIVTDSLNEIDGVAARVDLNKGCANIILDREVDEKILIAAIEKKGFGVKAIHTKEQ